MSSYSSNPKQLDSFAKRLEHQMLSKGKTLSPTALAREFNLRWRGIPVSVNAVRKWLTGEAEPTLDKLSLLGNWLDISPDWLKWGYPNEISKTKASHDAKELIATYR